MPEYGEPPDPDARGRQLLQLVAAAIAHDLHAALRSIVRCAPLLGPHVLRVGRHRP